MTAELLGASRGIDSVITRAAARRDGRICAILLDEAHVIAEWPEDVQQAFNVALRDSGPVGVIVASSERRAIARRDGPRSASPSVLHDAPGGRERAAG